MSDRAPGNLAASVRARLLNLARVRGETFDYILVRYGSERLLYRLSQSSHQDQFVLKGAMLLELWGDAVHRPTRDVDLLGFGPSEPEAVAAVFQTILKTEVVPDGLTFDGSAVRAEPIRDANEYHGVRVRLQANLDHALIPLQFDIGFGDAVTPPPEESSFPTLLDFPNPVLRTYPRETVVAEKFEAMVRLGLSNSRLKDYWDVWTLARTFPFDGPLLAEAIASTFGRRGSAVPADTPAALSEAFEREWERQWSRFLWRSGLPDAGTLAKALILIREFVMPPSKALTASSEFGCRWDPSDGWKPSGLPHR